MCCSSLLRLWAGGDLIEVGDRLMRPEGVILADGEVDWAARVREQLFGDSAKQPPPPARFDGEGCIREPTWRDRPGLL